MGKVKVTRERYCCPHHLLLAPARLALDRVEKQEHGWYYDALTAITFSALALEALANSFGERLIDRWDDFESATVQAKLRVVCKTLEVDVQFGSEPWGAIPWLTKFRNAVAHAKPKLLTEEKLLLSEDYEAHMYDRPESKLEKDITKPNAKRAVATVESILSILCKKLTVDQFHGLISDDWSGSAESIKDPPENNTVAR
jgi:hypothetical protein